MIVQPATAYPFDATTVDVDVYEGPAILHGWSFRETTGLARAELELFDGAGGIPIVPITLTAGQSTRDWLSGRGIYLNRGAYVSVTAGSVRGSIWAVNASDGAHAVPFDVHETVDQLVELFLRAVGS